MKSTKISRDELCRELIDITRAASRSTLSACACVTVFLLGGVVVLGSTLNVPSSALIQAMTTIDVPADSWHADTKLLWWCLYLTVSGTLFIYGAYGFLDRFLNGVLHKKIQSIAKSPDNEYASRSIPGESLDEQVESFYEMFFLARATQYWVLGSLYCCIILGAPSIGLLGIAPVPKVWYGTLLCAAFAVIGLLYNWNLKFGEIATNDQNAKVFQTSADKVSGGQG